MAMPTLLHHDTGVYIDNAGVIHGDLLIEWRASTKETLTDLGRRWCGREYPQWQVRVFPSEGGAFTYKLPLMGLCELKVQINYGPQRFRQGERKNNMVKSKKVEGRFI
jgi:hypothetical protein